MTQAWAIFQALTLLLAANGAPILATWLLGTRGAWPIDSGRPLADGYPMLGRSKTWRGLALAVVATAAVAPLLGLPWTLGALAGAAAMAGDLGSSFAKRRLGLASGSMAPGIDQVPEAVLPLLVCRSALGLSLGEVLLAAALFWIVELTLSRILYRMGIRDRPY